VLPRGLGRAQELLDHEAEDIHSFQLARRDEAAGQMPSCFPTEDGR
jgi:hypothetical protein